MTDSSRPPAQGLPFRTLLILTQYYYPEVGAAAIRLRAVAKELNELGVEVRILTGMPNYPLGRIFPGYRGKVTLGEEIDGLPVRRVWLYPAAGRGALRRLLNYLSFTAMAALVLLFTRRVDMIFVEAQPVTLALPAWLLKQLRGIPYIYNTPDLQVEIAQESRWIGSRALIRLAARLEGFLMRQALTVTTVTHAFMDHFVRYRGVPHARMSFLPNGADTEVMRPLPSDEAYVELMGVRGRTVFTYAGTHAHYHGLEVIVETAKRLRDRKDIVILMVGQGPMREPLMEMARQAGHDNVVFRDQIPFEDMARLMSITCASLVVLRDVPAARKMRPAKTITSLACGVPVVYVGQGEMADILVREGCGIRVEPDNADHLAKAIECLADAPALRRQMSLAARALAERDFSWRQLVRNWFAQVARIHAGQDPGLPAPREVKSPLGRCPEESAR